METPLAVLKKAQELVESFGDHFNYLGIYQGKQVYKYVFPKGLRSGFPYLFLYDERKKDVKEITGIDGLEIIRNTQNQ